MTVRYLVRPLQVHPHSHDALRMVRGVILSVLACNPFGWSWAEETVVPVYEEPLHRLVFESEPVRVLDVQLQPGETSLYHLHKDPIFYIALDISEVDAQVLGEDWRRTRVSEWRTGAVAHDLGHAEKPLTHRIWNVGGRTFRLIAVTNSGPPGQGAMPAPGIELPGEIETDVEYFRQSRITLEPEWVSEPFRSLHPVVVVQVSSGSAELAAGENSNRALNGPGAFAFVESDCEATLRNSGDLPVTLVVVEAR